MRGSRRVDAEFTEFVAQQSDRLYRSAYLLTTSPHAAEDLLQSTLAKAFAGWRRLRTADDPVAYCHRILMNTFLSERRLRRSGEIPVAELPDAAPRSGQLGDATSAEVADRVALMAALAELSPLDRAVVVERYWHDRSVAATAADLRLTESAVKNRTGRALRRLRDLLADDLDLPRSTS